MGKMAARSPIDETPLWPKDRKQSCVIKDPLWAIKCMHACTLHSNLQATCRAHHKGQRGDVALPQEFIWRILCLDVAGQEYMLSRHIKSSSLPGERGGEGGEGRGGGKGGRGRERGRG